MSKERALCYTAAEMERRESELENPERQGALQKWIPLLWIPPIALILVLAAAAYCGR